MVTLETTVTRENEVSLVELLVENPTPVARRVRVKDRLDGPLYPPRTNGVPERGWDPDGVEIVLEADERRALGYASEGSPADPPAEIVHAERAPDAIVERSDHDDVPDSIDASAAGVVRALADPTPPADAVAVPERGDESDGGEGRVPPTVESWFGEAEGRVERAETLAERSSVADAARAVGDEGGLAGVETVLEEIELDDAALRAIEERARSLRERGTDAADAVPIGAFRRLA